jgi:hypothetical protein
MGLCATNRPGDGSDAGAHEKLIKTTIGHSVPGPAFVSRRASPRHPRATCNARKSVTRRRARLARTAAAFVQAVRAVPARPTTTSGHRLGATRVCAAPQRLEQPPRHRGWFRGEAVVRRRHGPDRLYVANAIGVVWDARSMDPIVWPVLADHRGCPPDVRATGGRPSVMICSDVRPRRGSACASPLARSCRSFVGAVQPGTSTDPDKRKTQWTRTCMVMSRPHHPCGSPAYGSAPAPVAGGSEPNLSDATFLRRDPDRVRVGGERDGWTVELDGPRHRGRARIRDPV